MDVLDIQRIRSMDARAWYDFLRDEYFRWKDTAPNRCATTKRQLHRYVEDSALHSLLHLKDRLLAVDLTDVGLALSMAREIRGLGTAGASGLLALMSPEAFGTVDQFAVRSAIEESIPERRTGRFSCMCADLMSDVVFTMTIEGASCDYDIGHRCRGSERWLRGNRVCRDTRP